MRQSACLVFNPVMVDNYAAFFNCTPVDRTADYDGPDIKPFILVGWAGASQSIEWACFRNYTIILTTFVCFFVCLLPYFP